jgi:6-phosphogluconolactonase
MSAISESVVVVPTAGFAARAAELVAAALRRAASRPGRASVVLAGGATPVPVYRRLAALLPPSDELWARVDLLFGDERAVPRNDRESNYRMAIEALGGVAQAARLHRVRGELGAAAAATDYERRLRRLLEGRPAPDLVLLGIGEDGHTASLFPGESGSFGERWVAPARAPTEPRERITLTPALLDAGPEVFFLVCGARKAAIVRRLLVDRIDLPASRVRGVCSPTWVLDEAAAAGVAPHLGSRTPPGM